MRFLIVAPELEDTNYRGVQFVTKHVIKALSVLGHEVVLLTCHPRVKINVRSERLKERVLNTYFRQYLANGALLNAKMFGIFKDEAHVSGRIALQKLVEKEIAKPGFLQTVGSFLSAIFTKSSMVKVDKTRHSGIALVKYIDWAVNMPSFYRLANAMPKILKRLALEKIAKQVKADVVFISFPLMIPKLKSAKVIQIIYDLIPFEIAEEPVEFQWLPKLAAKIDYVTRNSDMIFTISEDSKEKILEVEANTNLYNIGAAMSAFREEINEYTEDSSILTKLDLHNTPYLVFISSVEKRKNVHRLLQAFAAIANENNSSLVIIGRKNSMQREIHKELDGTPDEIKKRVIFTGYLPEFDKYTLLKHARALVNPTLYEGFGLPVLEAFALGCPVVASVAGALAELSGDATLKIENPYSVSEISGALREILTNESLCQELIRKGYKQAEKYTEDVMQSNIEKAIQHINKK